MVISSLLGKVRNRALNRIAPARVKRDPNIALKRAHLKKMVKKLPVRKRGLNYVVPRKSKK